jgi:hypothetical protein
MNKALRGRGPRKKAPAKKPYPTPTNEMDWDQLGKLQSLGVDVSDDIIRDTSDFKGLDTVELVDPQQALRHHEDTRKKPFLEQLSDKLRDIGDTEREWREQGIPKGEPSELPTNKAQIKGKDFINKIINLLK